MMSNVNSFLNFDSGCIPDRELFVIGQNGANGSFLLHHTISSSVKEERSVCLLSFVQKFHHYNSIAQKTGVSLQTSTSSNQVIFIDGLEKLSTFCIAETSATGGLNILCQLMNSVLAALEELRKHSKHEPVVVIDDLAVLPSMGFHVDDVERFMNGLVWEALDIGRKVVGVTESVHSGVSIVVLCSYNEQDKEVLGLWKFLTHLSTIEVDVIGLQTGYCKDVHGQISVTWKDKIDSPRQHLHRRQQFKLSDSSVHFFAAGMSAAVL